MARVHTDFLLLTESEYLSLVLSLIRDKQIPCLEDVPLKLQSSMERKLEKEGFMVLKHKYVL